MRGRKHRDPMGPAHREPRVPEGAYRRQPVGPGTLPRPPARTGDPRPAPVRPAEHRRLGADQPPGMLSAASRTALRRRAGWLGTRVGRAVTARGFRRTSTGGGTASTWSTSTARCARPRRARPHARPHARTPAALRTRAAAAARRALSGAAHAVGSRTSAGSRGLAGGGRRQVHARPSLLESVGHSVGIKQVAAAPCSATCAARQPRARVTSAKPRLIAPAGARRYRVPLSQRKMTTAKTALARGVEALKGPPPRPPRRPRPALQAAPFQSHTLQSHTLQSHTLQSHTLQSHESPTTAPSSCSGTPRLSARGGQDTRRRSSKATPSPVSSATASLCRRPAPRMLPLCVDLAYKGGRKSAPTCAPTFRP